ncbi:hypothetical protein BZB76_1822 [Actinomadura pelletieri DSM 43383]|uniref:Uncharacterized protein n=1 Tax=Actinomadura pelletieri DSM 43383 TaxID=1120940 RepID=A0A495QSP9_9ACTN|nr:hypothetical protein BZB76_1822 [Actinomadura pelletieri DSM 43383]
MVLVERCAAPDARATSSGTRQLTLPSTLLEGFAPHLVAKPGGGPEAVDEEFATAGRAAPQPLD